MPANKGIGRKHKSGTGGSKSLAAARELSKTKVPGAAPAPLKRSRVPKPEPADVVPVERPLKAPRPVDQSHDAVRAAAESLDAAVDRFEQIELQYNNFQRRSIATMERLRKLRAQPGERSARWTREWQAQLDKFEAEEEQLALELERQDAVVDAARLQLEAAMSPVKECAMGGPVSHPPLKLPGLAPELAIQLQNIESLDDQQLAALKHELKLREEEAFQNFKAAACAKDKIEQEEAALAL